MAPSTPDPLPRAEAVAADETSWSVETPSAPVPTWKRHDRTHLEVGLRYLVPDDGPAGDQIWEAFYFLPESFRLDASTYSKRELFADSRSYFRFTIPRIELERVPEEARELARQLTSRSPDDMVRELKLFTCRVRTAIMEEAQATVDAIDPSNRDHATILVGGFLTVGSVALTAMRDVLGPQTLRTLSFERADPEVAKTAAWVDEYLSRVLETALIDLAKATEASDGLEEVARATIAAAVDEARYRQSRKAGPVGSADGSINNLEQIERRQHALKRFTSPCCGWMSRSARGTRWPCTSSMPWPRGIAMTFAVVIAVLYGQPNAPGQLGMWAAVVIVAYMGKDRLKAVLQNVFDSVVATRFPDRRWTISMPDTPSVLADVEESAGFIDQDELPDDVDDIRGIAYRDRLQELAGPESILRHRKTVRLQPEAMRTVAPEFAALTDVMRVDVSRWLTHTDDAKRTVTFADPDAGELFKSKLPRAYDVTVVYRLTDVNTPDAEWQVARIVVSRNGIRRVVPLQEI